MGLEKKNNTMAKNKKIEIGGKEIRIISQQQNDYISLTDMAKSQMQEAIIIKWLTLKSTIEYIGEWEALYNPDFNYTEFGTIKNRAGSNNFVLSVKNWIEATNAVGITAKAEWRDSNPNENGNIRDFATLEQLVVLSNMESINALLIQQQFSQSERLIQLNKVAITQMKSLLKNNVIKKLK